MVCCMDEQRKPRIVQGKKKYLRLKHSLEAYVGEDLQVNIKLVLHKYKLKDQKADSMVVFPQWLGTHVWSGLGRKMNNSV